jgi:hypothetical protein
VRFYPVQQRWRKIRPHLENPELQRILARDMSKLSPRFRPGMRPADFDSCDWRSFDNNGNLRRGRPPAFWDYALHAGCHWVVNFNRKLAELVEPRQPWRIVTTQKHSTVWDGVETLFDINFLALGVDPDEAWRLAKGRELEVGRELRCSTPRRAEGSVENPCTKPSEAPGRPFVILGRSPCELMRAGLQTKLCG